MKSNNCVVFLWTVFKASFAASIPLWFGSLVIRILSGKRCFSSSKDFINEFHVIDNSAFILTVAPNLTPLTIKISSFFVNQLMASFNVWFSERLFLEVFSSLVKLFRHYFLLLPKIFQQYDDLDLDWWFRFFGSLVDKHLMTYLVTNFSACWFSFLLWKCLLSFIFLEKLFMSHFNSSFL